MRHTFKFIVLSLLIVSLVTSDISLLVRADNTMSFTLGFKVPQTLANLYANFSTGSLDSISGYQDNTLFTIAFTSPSTKFAMVPIMTNSLGVDYFRNPPTSTTVHAFATFNTLDEIGTIYSATSSNNDFLTFVGEYTETVNGTKVPSAYFGSMMEKNGIFNYHPAVSVAKTVSQDKWIYDKGFYPLFIMTQNSNEAFIGGVRLAAQQQIAPKGQYDFYGAHDRNDSTTSSFSYRYFFYTQLYEYASQGAEGFMPLYADNNYLYLLVKRRGVLKNGKVTPALISLWKIDKQTANIVKATDYTYDNGNMGAAFALITNATLSLDGTLPVLYTEEYVDLTNGSVASRGKNYIIKFNPVSLTLDFNNVIDTETTFDKSRIIFAQQFQDKVIIVSYIADNKDQIEAVDLNTKKILWWQIIDVSRSLERYRISSSGILYTATGNKACAIDVSSGYIVATYDFPTDVKNIILLCVGRDPNVSWYAAISDKMYFYKLILSNQTTYKITAKAGLNGSITPSGDIQVKEKSSKTFVIKPDDGYTIKDVIVDGKSVGAVSTYTFENVTSDHTIEATFEPITYIITAYSGLGGTISTSSTITVNYGDSKTFNITP
ncbi:MAG: hypothetical protein ACPLSA_00505, partial [Caldanaerobacter sp.]